MADTKVSQLEKLAYTALVADDDFVVVDASDTSMAASGTTKRVSLVDTGTWQPELQGSVSNPSSVTYGGRTGQYTRIGDMVFFALQVTVTSFTGGSGSARISLPLTARNPANLSSYRCVVLLHNVTLPANVQDIQFGVIAGAAAGALSGTRSATSSYTVQLSDLGASALIQVSGIYHV